MVERDGTLEVAGLELKVVVVRFSLDLGPFRRAMEDLTARFKMIREQTIAFSAPLRGNRRTLRRLFGLPEPRSRAYSTSRPRRRKHPAIRRRPTRSQTRRVRSPRTR